MIVGRSVSCPRASSCFPPGMWSVRAAASYTVESADPKAVHKMSASWAEVLDCSVSHVISDTDAKLALKRVTLFCELGDRRRMVFCFPRKSGKSCLGLYAVSIHSRLGESQLLF